MAPSSDPQVLVTSAQAGLKALADPDKAGPMAAYLKTEMPFYGVNAGPRQALAKKLAKAHRPGGRRGYERAVRALWALPHREEKYLAIDLARAWHAFIEPATLPLYEQLVREGAWWDFIDPIASHLVGRALRRRPLAVWPVLDQWIDDPDMWIRRTAILSQLSSKSKTDETRLFDYCRRRAHEKEFFIRKAIGWALRQYSYQAPEAVRAFLLAERDRLSPLSFREGAKQLKRTGAMG